MADEHDRPTQAGLDADIEARQGTLLIGHCRLHLDSHELCRDDDVFVLEPKQLSVLLVLLTRAPRTVSHEQLLELIWPDVVVSDNVIHQAIASLRKAFGDNARKPSYIGTQARRGYRWVGPTPDKESAPIASLVLDPRPEKPSGPDGTEQPANKPRLAVWLVLLGAILTLFWQFYPEIKSETKPLKFPQLTLAVAPFEAGIGTNVTELQLAAFREQLLSALLNIKTIQLFDDPKLAQYGLSSVVNSELENLVTKIQLKDLQRQSTLWEHSFTHAKDDGRFVQAALAATLLAQVGNWFSVEQTILALGFADPVAVREFVHGQIEWQSFALGAGGDHIVAVEHFRESLRLEPDFWVPQLQLTILYANRLGGPATYAEHVRRTYDAANRLLELRRLHGDYASTMVWQGALALASQRLDFDYDFAESMWQQAREQGWNAGQVHVELASIYEAREEFERAQRYYEAARAGDAQVNSTIADLRLGYLLIAVNELEQARVVLATAATELSGSNRIAATSYVLHTFALLLLNDPQASTILDQAWVRFGEDHQDMFPGVLALGGREAEARRVLSEMTQRFNNGTLSRHWDAALGYLFLGDLDSAFVWLNRAVENREVRHVSHIKRARYLDPIRSDPRFDQLLHRIQQLEAIKSPLRAMVKAHRDAIGGDI